MSNTMIPKPRQLPPNLAHKVQVPGNTFVSLPATELHPLDHVEGGMFTVTNTGLVPDPAKYAAIVWETEDGEETYKLEAPGGGSLNFFDLRGGVHTLLFVVCDGTQFNVPTFTIPDDAGAIATLIGITPGTGGYWGYDSLLVQRFDLRWIDLDSVWYEKEGRLTGANAGANITIERDPVTGKAVISSSGSSGTPFIIAPNDKILALNTESPQQLSAKVSMTYDSNTGTVTLSGKDGVVLSTIDLPLEQILQSVDYDGDIHTLIFTWNTDPVTETTVDLEDLIDTYFAGDGLELAGGIFSVKIDGASVSVLSTSEDGLKINLSDYVTAGALDAARTEILGQARDAVNDEADLRQQEDEFLYNAVADLQSGKQDTLISGTTLKTVQGYSLLGSGGIVIESPFTAYYDQNMDVNYERWVRLLTCKTALSPAGWEQCIIKFDITMTARQLIIDGEPEPDPWDFKTIIRDILVFQGGWQLIGFQGSAGHWKQGNIILGKDMPEHLNLYFGSYQDGDGKWCTEIWCCNHKNATVDANEYSCKINGAEMISRVDSYGDQECEYYATNPLVMSATPAGTGRFAVEDGVEMWMEITLE